MGHQAQSQKQRTKRPDGRPVAAKTRQKIEAKLASKLTIQDLRVTSKQKGERKERDVGPRTTGDIKQSPTKSSEEKHIHALRKKLRQIEELIKHQDAGEDLDEAQLEKIARMEEIITEMETASKMSRRFKQ
jgi:uncharacterized protein with WD repeat